MDFLAVAGGTAHPVAVAAVAATENTGLEINFFWVIVAAANFLIFFAILWAYGFKPITGMLQERRTRIAEGLRDAETARRDRERTEAERTTVLQEARREANELLGRAQKAAQELRESDLKATREELERLRQGGCRRDRGREAASHRRPAGRGRRPRSRRRRQGRRRVDDRRPPAAPRQGVPVRVSRRGVEALMARPTGAARRYAAAAFELAKRDELLDRWAAELRLAGEMAGDPTVARFADDPALDLAVRRQVVERLLGDRVSRQVRNLVLLLVDRGRFSALPAVVAEYALLLREERGIVAATVTSAVALDPKETAAVQARVEALTGRQVQLATAVDPALIGGLTVRVGDRLIDASVRGRLERLRDRLVVGAR